MIQTPWGRTGDIQPGKPKTSIALRQQANWLSARRRVLWHGRPGPEAGIAIERVEVGLLFNIRVDPRLQTVVNGLTPSRKRVLGLPISCEHWSGTVAAANSVTSRAWQTAWATPPSSTAFGMQAISPAALGKIRDIDD
jgi:hypothetical protein